MRTKKRAKKKTKKKERKRLRCYLYFEIKNNNIALKFYIKFLF